MRPDKTRKEWEGGSENTVNFKSTRLIQNKRKVMIVVETWPACVYSLQEYTLSPCLVVCCIFIFINTCTLIRTCSWYCSFRLCFPSHHSMRKSGNKIKPKKWSFKNINGDSIASLRNIPPQQCYYSWQHRPVFSLDMKAWWRSLPGDGISFKDNSPRPFAVCGSGQGKETDSETWVESKLAPLKVCVFSKSFISLGLTFSFTNRDVKSIDIQGQWKNAFFIRHFISNIIKE